MLCKIVDECGNQKDNKGMINFNAVKKQVLKSQPPRAGDVPDLVDYVRVWGGLPSGSFVRELTKLASTMPSDRVVSGSFFRLVANLKDNFPTQNLPSHLINAVIYTHAQASDNVVDGISRFITKAEVASFGSKDKRDAVYEANNLLKRGRDLLKGAPCQVEMELSAKLKVDIVMCVIDRPDKSKDDGKNEKKTLAQIAEEFAKNVCIRTGTDVKVQQPPTEGKQADVDESSEVNVVMYQEDGSSHAVGRYTVMNKGFKEKMCVMKAKGNKREQWKICAIGEDGSVSINKLTVDGSVDQAAALITVQIDEFLDTYKEATPIELIKHYPASHPSNHAADIVQHVVRGKAFEAVYKMITEWEVPDLMLMVAPERKTIAKIDYEINKLSITPATSNIEIVASTAKKECPRKSIECTFGDGLCRVMLHPASAKPDFTNPFWHCKVTNKKEEANMELVERSYRHKAPTNATKNMNKDEVFSFHVATNFKQIRAYDELVLYRDQPDEDAKPKRSTTAMIDSKKKARIA